MLREQLPLDPPSASTAHGGRVLHAIPPPAPPGNAARGSRLLCALLRTADTAAVCAGLLVTNWLTQGLAVLVSYPWVAGGAVLAAVATASRLGLYRSAVCQMRTVESAGLLRVAATATAVATALLLYVGQEVAVGTVAVLAVSTYLALRAGRAVYGAWLRSARRRGRHVRPVLIIAGPHEASRIARLLTHADGASDVITGVIDAEARPMETPVDAARRAARAVRAAGAGGAVIGRDVNHDVVTPLISALMMSGIHVQLCSGLEGIGTRRLLVHDFNHDPFLYVTAPVIRRWHLLVKRLLDVVGAILGTIVLLPVLGAATLAIKLDDGGPVLFRQQRVGLRGRLFTVLKFRTMVEDADRLLPDVASFNERSDGPLFTCANDPRVTRAGAWLRRTSVDELPQLFNVIAGSMSLIGPRPPLPAEASQFDSELLRRFSVRPGMSGLWQVEARRSPLFWAYRRLDLYYVDNWSLGLDLAILLSTLRVILCDIVGAPSGPGAGHGGRPLGQEAVAATDYRR